MSKSSELIKQLNQSSEVLTKENKEIFEDIVLYIRTSSLTIKDMEEFLQQILDSFINAQNNNKSIEEVLGTDDIKSYCDEIIQAYKSTYGFMEHIKEYIMYVGMFLFILPLIDYVGDLIVSVIKNKGFSGFSFALNVDLQLILEFVLVFPLIYLAFAYVKKGCFDKKKVNPVKEFFMLWIICMAFIGAFVLILYFVKNRALFTINILVVLAIAAVLYFVGQYYSEK